MFYKRATIHDSQHLHSTLLAHAQVDTCLTSHWVSVCRAVDGCCCKRLYIMQYQNSIYIFLSDRETFTEKKMCGNCEKWQIFKLWKIEMWYGWMQEKRINSHKKKHRTFWRKGKIKTATNGWEGYVFLLSYISKSAAKATFLLLKFSMTMKVGSSTKILDFILCLFDVRMSHVFL